MYAQMQRGIGESRRRLSRCASRCTNNGATIELSSSIPEQEGVELEIVVKC